MKYGSTKLPTEVKSFCEWHLSHYSQYQKDLQRYKLDFLPSPTARYDGMPSGKGVAARNTELTALHLLGDRYIWETQRVIDGIDYVMAHSDGETKELLEMCFFSKNRKCSLEGAAAQLCISKSSAYRKLNIAMAMLATELGYIPFH